MKSIQQQLFKLGITDNLATNITKPSKSVVNNPKVSKTIVQQLQEKLVEIIILKQPFKNFRKHLAKKNLDSLQMNIGNWRNFIA